MNIFSMYRLISCSTACNTGFNFRNAETPSGHHLKHIAENKAAMEEKLNDHLLLAEAANN